MKLREKDIFGEERDVLYVKGSGWDLETIEAEGFVPLPLAYMQRLPSLPALSDAQMVNELNTHVLRAGAPSPSVETLLHALVPHRYVDHTHADAVLAVSNAPDGEKRIREIYGERVAVIPYAMAGFSSRALRARVPAPGERENDRRGARLARHRLLRRRGARVLRAHDRARLHGGGVPAEEEGLACLHRNEPCFLHEERRSRACGERSPSRPGFR